MKDNVTWIWKIMKEWRKLMMNTTKHHINEKVTETAEKEKRPN